MNTPSSPPQFAETLLRLLLARRDRESVSGDLLEEYRDEIHPSRGLARADAWYCYQVLGFFFRSNAAPALLLFVAIIGRTAFDWLVPTTEFATRAAISTFTSAAILTVAGFLASWRSEDPLSGTLVGTIISIMIAPLVIFGMMILLALSHDAELMAAVAASGGLSEAVTFPLMLSIPGGIFGTAGGFLARVVRDASN